MDKTASSSPFPAGNPGRRTPQTENRLAPTCGPHRLQLVLAVVVLLCCVFCAAAEQRFPPPDFESGHKLPITTTPAARSLVLEYLDVAVLGASLAAGVWLIYRKRSRNGIVILSIFSLAYFGFWKKGCICAIGSVQNVALSLFSSAYAVPLTVLAFFILPLAVALFFGRAFCAGVCPHGALQDLVLLKPMKVPAWLEQGLGIMPYIYLGAGVIFAATGSAFIICQYDPFVPVFRMSGRTLMVIAGAVLLVLGVFIGRPYCRFLCPFGALLKLAAAVAKQRVRVTPDYCTQCRLCEASCPFGAMRFPEAPAPGIRGLATDRRRLAMILVILPFLLAAGTWLGMRFSATAARLHPTVTLAERLVLDRQAANDPSSRTPMSGTLHPPTPEELELERAREIPEEVFKQAVEIRRGFDVASPIFGAWVGLVIGVKLISLALRRKRTDFEPSSGDCLACARCFEYCPNELVRRGLSPAVALETAAATAQRQPVVLQSN